MQSTQVVLVSTCGMRPNGHIRVTNKTLVKSSKVRTIEPRDCNAKSHVIMPWSLVFMAKRTSEQQVASSFVL